MRDIEALREVGWEDSNDDGGDGTHALSAATSSLLHTGRQKQAYAQESRVRFPHLICSPLLKTNEFNWKLSINKILTLKFSY